MEQHLEIIRVEKGDGGTFGAVVLDGKALCVSLEEHADRNLPDTAIPEGEYVAFRRYSPKHKYDVWQLRAVPGRTYIQIHSGNTILDTEGCIMLGQYWGKLKGNRAILNSGETFKLFMAATEESDTLIVSIRSAIVHS